MLAAFHATARRGPEISAEGTRDALLGLGSTYRTLGRSTEAESTLRRATEEFPDDVDMDAQKRLVVPYKFCSDEFESSSPDCWVYDRGADGQLLPAKAAKLPVGMSQLGSQEDVWRAIREFFREAEKSD